jgi:dihydroflavonol-4-reductase
MRALVLGATGHLGNAIARELLKQGFEVTATSRRRLPATNLADLPVRFLSGDDALPGQLEEWVRGHALVVDAAAPYHFRLASGSPASPGEKVTEVATRRMRALLQSASRHDAILAYVSSFTTLPRQRAPLEAMQNGALRFLHPYFELKNEMEAQVLSAARSGLRAVVVNPTLCLGPWDLKPLQFCLIPLALRGEIPATSGHALNFIDVRDVACALLAAVKMERFGQPIPLCGHNTTVDGLTAAICRLGGARPPKLRVPAQLTAMAAYGNEVLSSLGLSPLSYPSLGMILLLEQRWESPSSAQRDLGVPLRPLSRTLAEAIDWYREIGYLDRSDSAVPTGSALGADGAAYRARL